MRKTITVIGYYIISFSDGSWSGMDKWLSDTETIDDVKRNAETQYNKKVTSVEYHACEPVTYSYEGGEIMKLKVTKAMVKILNKYAKDRSLRFCFATTSPGNYTRIVDYDLFKNESDFDYSTGEMKYILVVYPGEFYALPKTLTTYDLKRLYVSGDTVETFCNRVIENMTI